MGKSWKLYRSHKAPSETNNQPESDRRTRIWEMIPSVFWWKMWWRLNCPSPVRNMLLCGSVSPPCHCESSVWTDDGFYLFNFFFNFVLCSSEIERQEPKLPAYHYYLHRGGYVFLPCRFVGLLVCQHDYTNIAECILGRRMGLSSEVTLIFCRFRGQKWAFHNVELLSNCLTYYSLKLCLRNVNTGSSSLQADHLAG